MNLIKKSTWMMVIWGAVAGCAGEGENATSSTDTKAPLSAIPPAPPIPTTKPATKTDDPPAVEGPKAESGKSDKSSAKLTADEIAAIKELPEAEQAPATQQIVCPVSAHNLGSMGKPIKVTADGRTIYLCCDSCEKKFKSDPKAYFAKLDHK